MKSNKKPFRRHFRIYFKNNHPAYIVKKEQRDKKSKFSAFELELKPNVDISFPEIKKVGETSDTGSHHTNSRSRYESSTFIKTKKAKKGK